jgi:hypothetical protein
MKIRTASACCLLLAGALCLGAAKQSGQPKTTSKNPWNPTNAVAAFTAALTKSGYDRTFRNRLTAPNDSAKEAVSEEGNIDIPKEVVIIFYESETYQNHFAFYLPDFNENTRTTYNYSDYFQCCFPSFRLFELPATASLAKTTARKEWSRENAAVAFTAALTKSGYNRPFRNGLTVSCDSAKEAVSEEGNIDIPKEVVIVFHENELNEKYHIFSLPPFNENARTKYEYRDHFMCCYNVW